MGKSGIEQRIESLEKELKQLKCQLEVGKQRPVSVIVPDEMKAQFGSVEEKVSEYFDHIHFDPESGEITIEGERYLLFRSGSLSHEFIDFIKERYGDRSPAEAVSIGNNFLYDNAKVIGKRDSITFHSQLNLVDPIDKLSAGPVHFAYTGWANVEILVESNPTTDDNFVLKFQHHNSFEAQDWIKAGKKTEIPVCTMNCGYSAGWCEESFGIPLTTVEVTCEAKGDDACTFIMAPPHKIESYVGEVIDLSAVQNFEIPVFFKRKHIEEQLKESIHQKEMLIQEIHHRVKNNLQVIVSLLRLQMDKQANKAFREEFEMSINRVNTMAAVHELMYQQNDFDSVSLRSYFTELTKSLVNFYTLSTEVDVDLEINIGDKELSLEKSIPLGLIMNEVTCNAFKHAFVDGGKFSLSLNEEEGKCVLVMEDDGGGYDESIEQSGLGLSLIEILCDQLDATMEVSNSSTGLKYKIVFELDD